MSEMLRVGIVGAQFAARFHLNAYRRVYDVPVKVVGVSSAGRASREKFAAAHGIEAFESNAALIAACDVVDICAPPYVHEEIAVAALKAGRHVIIEKPFTGCFGPPGDESFRGNTAPKGPMLDAAMASARNICEAEAASGKWVMYAENWVYAPSVQKEREVIEKSGAQVLRLLGEESHSGSHSPYYGIWNKSGGGSIVGKGCHPLTAMLYLKQAEGRARLGRPIRPRAVCARTHELTRSPHYQDSGLIRTDYLDIEDYCFLHVVFDDDTVADVLSSEVVLGGVYSWLEVFANNHRARVRVNPSNPVEVFAPRGGDMKDVYLVEKLETKEGWSTPFPDEDWTNGFYQEAQDFMEAAWHNRAPISGSLLGLDTTAVMYAAYLSDEQRGAEVEVPRED